MDWPGEKLLIRLWETIEKSGVGLFRPWQSARVGNAESKVARNRMLLIAAAEREIEMRRNGISNGPQILIKQEPELLDSFVKKIEPTWNSELLSLSFTSAQEAEYLRKEINIEKAVAHAEISLGREDGEPPDQAIDMDWFFRWRDYVGGMSSEALQQLWGNVLAGELKAPGMFAYRTLDFLRSLTQEEAKLIERLASNIVEGFRFIHGQSLARMNNGKSVASCINAAELTLLEELGVLSGISTLGYVDQKKPFKMPDGRYIHLIACGGRGILATTEDPNKETGLAFYRLTKLGANVLTLVQVIPDEVHLLSLGQLLAGDGFKVEIGDVFYGDGGRQFRNPISINPLPDADVNVVA
ncbi:hypothetical protein J2W28_005486 [Variovorax boronicumulans]|uniref:DUF2806 domain-containing protein n=1 Tax=Variovorax boronicumulans TaxID=436515 RepID=UPI00277ED1AD|nr:DUF2806 domain-containing protein [Variovorax boronicumulans]MDP9995068.1 hypothetical protein [Variovorax boronicumulans]MDQ0006316.1 hypothetical protein [Variovorax boronicumulans]